MQKIYDVSAIRLTLRSAVEKGHFTVEQLDTPSPGFVTCTAVDREHFPGGYQGVQFRNLLREAGVAPEAVQVTSERDLPPLPHGVTPAQPQELPVTLETETTINAPFS